VPLHVYTTLNGHALGFVGFLYTVLLQEIRDMVRLQLLRS